MARYKNIHSEEADNTVCKLARKTLADEESLSHVGTLFLSGTFRLESEDGGRSEMNKKNRSGKFNMKTIKNLKNTYAVNIRLKMRRLLPFFLCIMIAIGMAVPTVHGDIFRWKDEDGNWRYSDQPPPESQEDSWWDEKGQVIHTTSPEKSSDAIQDSKAASETQQSFSGKGMLWKIELQGPAPSYILGTIHSEDPRVLNFSPSLEKAFTRTDTFIMEVILDETALFQMSTSMIFTDGRTLKSITGQELFDRALKAMVNHGVTDIALNRMKPWAVMSMLSVPMPETGLFMDVVLYEKAKSEGKKVFGLESAGDQLKVFDNMPLEDQVALLEETLNQIDKLPQLFEKMIEAYINGDLDGVAQIGKQFVTPENKALADRMLKRLNDDRNLVMADQMLPHLLAGNAFIAVGALHLHGPNGLVALLSDKGFKVTPVQ